ncbi:MAG: hypothetical protein AABX52_03895 [Nanoarchaeota archaeon]
MKIITKDVQDVDKNQRKNRYLKQRMCKEELSKEAHAWLLRIMQGKEDYDIYFIAEQGVAS